MRSNRGYIVSELAFALFIFLVILCAVAAVAHAGRCRDDKDCPPNHECREASDDKWYCYDREPPPEKNPDKKRRRYKRICDKEICGAYQCSPAWPLVSVMCPKCCDVPIDD